MHNVRIMVDRLVLWLGESLERALIAVPDIED